MEMQNVKSSQIESVGHNAETSVLRIRFKGGSEYEYKNVDTVLFERLVKAESIGSFFTKHIKCSPVTYPYKKIK